MKNKCFSFEWCFSRIRLEIWRLAGKKKGPDWLALVSFKSRFLNVNTDLQAIKPFWRDFTYFIYLEYGPSKGSGSPYWSFALCQKNSVKIASNIHTIRRSVFYCVPSNSSHSFNPKREAANFIIKLATWLA